MATSQPGFALAASSTAVTTVTTSFPAAPGGMNRSLPQHAIPTTDAWTLFDCLVNQGDLIRRRGPVAGMDSASSSRSIGLAQVQGVNGVDRMAQLVAASGGGSGTFKGFNGAGTSTLAFPWPVTPGTSPYELYCSNDFLNGGVLVGSGASYNNGTRRTLGLWMGSQLQATGNITAVSGGGIGGTTVTVDSSPHGALFDPGMFVFADAGAFMGVVKSVSGAVITFENPSLANVSSTVNGTPVRGLCPRITTGTITTDTGSNEVNGGNTKFLAQGITASWDLFTPNYTYIGSVTSVNSDAQLVLTGNAAVSLDNSDYIAVNLSGSYSMTADVLGFLNAQFGSHQFYAQGTSLRFSDLVDPEGVDLTNDGNEIEFSADPIRAIVPTLSSLVSLSENQAFALTGAIGTTPGNWRGQQVHDDGTICGMSAVAYQGGTIWAGKRGIWYWDGSTPINIAANLSNDYINFVSDSSRAYGAIIQNHYFLFVEDGEAGIFFRTKGTDVTDTSRVTFVINLVTGATTLLSGVEMRGSLVLPSDIEFGTSLYSISTTTNKAEVCLGDSLFQDEGQDDAACLNGPLAGPDFYAETGMADIGDPQRTKRFKLLMSHYNADGGNLCVDTVVGLNRDGVTVTTQLIDTAGAWADSILHFSVTAQVLALRFYQSTISGVAPSTVPANTNRVTLGPWALGYRLKLPGRT